MKNLRGLTVLGPTMLALMLLSACTPETSISGGVSPIVADPSVTTSAHMAAGASAGPPAATAQETPKAVPGIEWADGSNLTALRIPLETAVPAKPGDDYRVTSTTQKLIDSGKYLDPFALTTKGALVGGMSKSPGPDLSGGASAQISETVGVFESGKFSPFAEPRSASKNNRGHTIIAGSVANGYAVWSENLAEDPPYENISMGEWRIVSANLETGVSKNLASSTEGTPGYHGELQISGDGSPRPMTFDGKAFWQASTTSGGDYDISSKILSVPLNGSGAMKLERSNAAFPARLGDSVVAVDRVNNQNGSYLGKKISRVTPGSGEKQLLRIAGKSAEEKHFFSFDGDGQAISFTYGNDFYIVNTEKRTAISTAIPADSKVVGVTHCGPNVSWTFRNHDGVTPNDSRYVYDDGSSTLRVVTDSGLTGPARCAGDYLSWSVGADKDDTFKTWDVVTYWGKLGF